MLFQDKFEENNTMLEKTKIGKTMIELFGGPDTYRAQGSNNGTSYQIIIDQSKKLSKIFDKINNETCSICKTSCCSTCGRNIGFFSIPEYHTSYILFDKLQKIYKFNKEFGFFNNDKKTCNLPRELRSTVCLKFKCNKIEGKISKEIYGRHEIEKCVKIIELVKKEARIPY